MKKALFLVLVLGLFLGTNVATSHAASLKDLYAKISDLFSTVNDARQSLPASSAYILDSQVDSVNSTIDDLKKNQTVIAADPSLTIVLRGPVKRSDGPETIKKLQNMLKQHGYLKATPNGVYGLQTAAAVRAFQQANGIEANGNAGPKTIARLNEINQLIASCVQNSSQSILVTPRGGETFKGKIPFRWISCTPSNTSAVTITLKNEGTAAQVALTSSTADDGSETITLGSNVEAGTYRAMVSVNNTPGTWSNTFTVTK